MHTTLLQFCSLGLVFGLAGCTPESPDATGAGGAMGSGGMIGSGGAVGSGGTIGSGGAVGSGGASADAGTIGSPGCGSSRPPPCDTAVTGPCTLSVGTKTRQYFVVVPTNYSSSTAAPVVFTFHGRGGTAQQLLPSGGYGGFALYGERTGFPNAIYVVPQGLDSGTDAGNDYGWPNTNDQDINFVKAMISWLEANYCVDESRIFSTGMSYGGMISNTIACEMPDVFRAIGVMSGSLGWGSYVPTCVNHPIAAWFTHGDADTVVPISGDQNARDLFIKNNGCSTTNTQQISLVDTNTSTNVTCTVYNVCTTGNYPVVWCPVAGEAHAIPSFAGSEIAKFFKQF